MFCLFTGTIVEYTSLKKKKNTLFDYTTDLRVTGETVVCMRLQVYDVLRPFNLDFLLDEIFKTSRVKKKQ